MPCAFRHAVCAVALITCCSGGLAKAQTGPVNGIRPADLRVHALTGATIVTAPGIKIENATLVLRDGVIEAVGADVSVPAEARVWDASGLTIYPGLIDPAVMIAPAAGSLPSGPGAHWNPRVHPQMNMADQPALSESLRKELRGLGFTAAAVYPSNGLLRGSGVVVALTDEPKDQLVYKPTAAMAVAFDHGGAWETAIYPGSLMGSIALLRQTLEDAQWHAACRKVYADHPQGNEPPMRADALAALGEVVTAKQPLLFEVSDEHNALRAAKVIGEFKLDAMLLGSGYEFRRLDDVAALNLPIIVPLQFPDKPKIASLIEAERITLRDMQTWEQAPTNLRRLHDAGVTIALTTHRLKERKEFLPAVRTAIRHGLSEDDALAALTIAPAKLLGLEQALGTLEPGKAANFVLVKGSLFDKKPEIRETWINGRRFEVDVPPKIQLAGKGVMTIRLEDQPALELPAEIDTEESTIALTLPDKKSMRGKSVSSLEERVSFILEDRVFQLAEPAPGDDAAAPQSSSGYVRFTGVIEGETLLGEGELPDGRRCRFVLTVTEPKPDEDEVDKNDGVSGTWTVKLGGAGEAELKLDRGPDDAVTGTVKLWSRTAEITGGTFDPKTGALSLKLALSDGRPATIDATIEGNSISGMYASSRGELEFSGGRGDADERNFVMPPQQLAVPFGEYGLSEPATPQTVLITNATIWTCGPNGVIENGWMLVSNGRIEALGAGSPPQGTSLKPQDAGGKHLTPGLIDCHSHTGIDGGVNEWTQTNTAEVRIGDCIDPDDINWYRELAGGLTACNQLHGSANPIGGQNSIVKLKWGHPASVFPVEHAHPGIKFALGENVTRPANRYPKSRMGVETFIRDAFTAARDYQQTWKEYGGLSSSVQKHTMPPRKDLELQALVQILEGERDVHCHSYRQDEILMLMRLAEGFGFRIAVFQHILEGYKVAEVMKAHGAAASSFSDWWGYKIEVQDAIPYNGSILHDVGVNVSFNSDSSELARRMNTEAAKAVRYGDVVPEEALKFVTLNPAIQMGIDQRTGSLEVGKDADFVIWSGDPLSAYSRCEQTWIEGAKYFDLETDRQMRESIAKERQRLTQKVLAQTHGVVERESAKPPSEDVSTQDKPKPERLLARMIEARQAWIEEQLRLGRDPTEVRAGECGCNDAWTYMTGARE